MEKLIKMTFSAALECSDKVYVHALAHKQLIIGQRGLVGQEIEKGIVLSFSNLSCNEMSLDDEGISAKLRFGGKWEHVFIPYKSVLAIFDDLHLPSFLFNFHSDDEVAELNDHEEEIVTEDISDKKTAIIVKPDFLKNKNTD